MALTNEPSTNESAAASRKAAPAAESRKAGRKGKAATKDADEAAGSRGKAVSAAKPTSNARLAAAVETKTAVVLNKLNSPRGVTIEVLIQATGWQAHSVRGFLSAVVRKKLGFNLISETGKDGIRRYRIDDAVTGPK